MRQGKENIAIGVLTCWIQTLRRRTIAEVGSVTDWISQGGAMKFRRCFAEPPPETELAIKALVQAAIAHDSGDRNQAECFLIVSDRPEIMAWRQQVMTTYRPNLHGPGPSYAIKPVPAERRDPRRMPLAALKREILERDGHLCRFCGMILMLSKTRKRIERAYPEATRASCLQWDSHALLRGMDVQFDHIVPWSRGGPTSLGNMVITCPPCNYGRGSWTPAESYLFDPRHRAPEVTDWDGLNDAFHR